MDHINSIDPAIKFTVEDNQEMIPFLDTLDTPKADNFLSITVYCKPTHTDQYLQWDSHYNLSAGYSIIGTLTHRAKMVCTSLELFLREYNTLERLWAGANTLGGPLTGFKVNILTANRRTVTPTTSTRKTTLHKAPTIQVEAQKEALHQGKSQHRSCSHPLHPRTR